MRLRLVAAALAWLGQVCWAHGDGHRGHEARLAFRNEWTVQVDGDDADVRQVARQLGLRCAGPLKGLEHVYLLVKTDHPPSSAAAAEFITQRLAAHPQVKWVEQQFSKHRSKRGLGRAFNDPRWNEEWYIGQTGSRHRRVPQQTGTMNVLQAMEQDFTGRGVKIVIIDDGLEHNNTDIASAYEASLGWDVVDSDGDPAPRYDGGGTNEHGTKCAGVVSMQPNNGFCGVGVAPGARLGAVRLLDGVITDRTEGEAFSVFSRKADIISVSWGPTDSGQIVDMPGRLLEEAIETGILHGRDGKGVIYVWANGNGGVNGDNCACDGYASSPFSLSVGSVDRTGRMPWYGEICSSTIAVTYALGEPDSVVTTELHNGCTSSFSGTSASAPMAAGMVALMLEVNPELTWREVQHIFVYTSQQEPVMMNEPWVTNGVGLHYSTRVGFGLVDAGALLNEARRWNSTRSANVTRRYCQAPGSISPESGRFGSEVPATVTFEARCSGENDVRHLEHAQVVLHLDYARRGALRMDLTSPQGTTTAVLLPRRNDVSTAGFDGFRITSVAAWGEDPCGKWTLLIRDDTEERNYGDLHEVKLILWGTKAPIHNMHASQLPSAEEQLPLSFGPAEQRPKSSGPADHWPESSEPADQRPESSGTADQRPEPSEPADQRPEFSGPADQRPESSGPADQRPESSEPADQRPESSGPADQRPESSEPAKQLSSAKERLLSASQRLRDTLLDSVRQDFGRFGSSLLGDAAALSRSRRPGGARL